MTKNKILLKFPDQQAIQFFKKNDPDKSGDIGRSPGAPAANARNGTALAKERWILSCEEKKARFDLNKILQQHAG